MARRRAHTHRTRLVGRAAVELRPTTRRDYESLLRNHVAPSLDEVPLRDLTKARVKRWWEALDPEKPRARSKAFQFLHTAMNAAMEVDLLAINPVTLPRRTRLVWASIWRTGGATPRRCGPAGRDDPR